MDEDLYKANKCDCGVISTSVYDKPYDWGIFDISTCDIKYNDDVSYTDGQGKKIYGGLIKSFEWQDEEET